MNNWKKSLIAGVSFSLTLLGYNTFAQTMTTHAHTQIVPSTKYQLAETTPCQNISKSCTISGGQEISPENPKQTGVMIDGIFLKNGRRVRIREDGSKTTRICFSTENNEVKEVSINTKYLHKKTCQGN